MTPFEQSRQSALAVFNSLTVLAEPLEKAALVSVECLQAGSKLLVCGNGGSACEAQHLVGELVGRYKLERRALPAIALNADGATLSCIGNDYRFEDIFSRQVEAFSKPGDLLVVFTTSGRSLNILKALATARQLGIRSISFLGRDGGPALPLTDYAIVVPHLETARIQEAHQFLLHCLMDRIETGLGLA